MHTTMHNLVARVVHTIPPEILDLCLRIANRHGHFVNNTTEFVMKITRERVLLDANISGGPVKQIVVRGEWREQCKPDLSPYDGGTGGYDIYRIPPDARDNLPLTQAIRLSFAGSVVDNMPTAYVADNGFSTLSAADSMLASWTMNGGRNAPLVELLSGDLIQIFPSQNAHVDWILDCRTAYDENFSQVSVNGVRTLCKMVELAVKAYTYVNLVVSMDRAANEFGVDVSSIRAIVEECRDANQQYDEQLVLWLGASMQDPKARNIYMQYNV